MTRFAILGRCAVSALALVPQAPPGPPLQSAEIRWELAHDPQATCWRVHIAATGLEASAGEELSLVLQNWGEWTEVGSDYLRELASEPPLEADPRSPSRYLLDVPEGWDGTLAVSYVLPLAAAGSSVTEAHPLLPVHDGTDALGYSINVLADVLMGGEPLPAARTLRFSAPEGVAIATGWGGVSTGSQQVSIDHPIDNVPLLFGRTTGRATSDADGLALEVVQLGAARDATTDVLAVARPLIALCGRTAERPYPQDLRIFLTPLKRGGTRTGGGIVVGYGADDLESGLSDGLFHLLIHELAHGWVGGMLPPPGGETLVWFHEGFNEYLCLWHATAAGLRGPDWFADEIMRHESAARRSSLGRVAFADPGVRWRDGDGPNERMGYKGGALLAFLADVELRRQGRPGLPLLVADLLRAGEPLSPAAIQGWMEKHGLKDFHARRVARPDPLSDVGDALLALGFEASESEAALTYLGLRTDGDGPPCLVMAVDPDGPAARAGFRPGDRVQAWSPARDAPPLVRPSVDTPYRFGLAVIASGAKTAEISVLRDGEEVKLSVEPRLIAGGYRRSYRRGSPAVDAFFRYEPPARR